MQIIFDPMKLEDRGAVTALIDQFSINPMEHQVSTTIPVPLTSAEPTGFTDVDKNGTPWDVRFHTSTKIKTIKGLWKRRKGVDKENYDDYAAQFSMAPTAQSLAPTAQSLAPTAQSLAPTAQSLAPTAPEIDMLVEIDDMFADLDESGHIGDFSNWVSSVLNWAKPGAKNVSELEDDLEAQKRLFDHLQTVK